MPLSPIRLPIPDKRDIYLVFSTSVFVVFTWTIIVFILQLNNLLVLLELVDILFTLVYAFSIDLVESLAVTLLLVITSMMFPRKYLKDNFRSIGPLLILLVAGWAMAFAFRTSKYNPDPQRESEMLAWAGIFFSSVVGTIIMAPRYETIKKIGSGFAERTLLFVNLYVLIGIASAALVIIRNLGIG